MERNYILNQETQKIELHFTKEEYSNLSVELKKELKSAYLFSGYNKCWVSRSKNNHYSAIKVAKKLGFTEKKIIGERLTYEQELKIKAERAERKIERYEQYADNAEKRAENLQKELNSYCGDIAFFTQPIIANHAGSRAFANKRQKIYDKYHKGFEEYKKSEYFKERAVTCSETVEMSQLKDKRYLDNRIKENKSTIAKIEKNIKYYEDQKELHPEVEAKYNQYIDELLEKMEYYIDKLAFFENKLEEIGGITYSKDNIKVGYIVKIRGWLDNIVVKVNPTTIEIKTKNNSYLKYAYAEIRDVKIPENYTEPNDKIVNPFAINDILARQYPSGYTIYFQILKTTQKGVYIQEITTNEYKKPVLNQFADKSKQMLKKITKDSSGNVCVVIDDWCIYKYN